MEIPLIISQKRAFDFLKTKKGARGAFQREVIGSGVLQKRVGCTSVKRLLLDPERWLSKLTETQAGQVALLTIAEMLANAVAEIKKEVCLDLKSAQDAIAEIDKILEGGYYGTSQNN